MLYPTVFLLSAQNGRHQNRPWLLLIEYTNKVSGRQAGRADIAYLHQSPLKRGFFFETKKQHFISEEFVWLQ
jgi:hypothetical protein